MPTLEIIWHTVLSELSDITDIRDATIIILRLVLAVALFVLSVVGRLEK